MQQASSSKVDGGKTSRNHYNVSAEDFVRVWQLSNSLDEASERLKMPKEIVSARAGKYRRDGVWLKRMRRGRKKGEQDIQHLNSIIEEIARNQKTGR